MDYTLNISIQLSVLNSAPNTGAVVTTIFPQHVGIAGGIWRSDQYNNYGLDGKYPVFAEAPKGWNNTWQYYLIHIRSRVAWNYTLLDFFNVWGQPLRRAICMVKAGSGTCVSGRPEAPSGIPRGWHPTIGEASIWIQGFS